MTAPEMSADYDYGDETYIDDDGTERCDNCDEPVDECECRCPDCGDRIHTECPHRGEHPESE